MRKVQVSGKIVEKPEAREVTLRTGQKAKVADLTLEDETGKIK
jgi:ssDNA-binding replication factor A large subunit